MRKEKVFSIILFSVLVWMLFDLPFVIIAKAQSQEIAVGVKVGDWVKYGNILVTWNSTHMKPDPELEELNNTLWFRNEVLDIKDTLIIFNQIAQFRNETQKTSKFQLDIYTGIGNGSLMFTSKGLSSGYLLYPESSSLVLINETMTRTYANVTREVNHLNLTQTESTEDDPPNILHVSISHYWDKETGVLTERFGSGIYINQTGSQITSWTRSDKIVETNLWSSEEKPEDEQEEPQNEQDKGTTEFPYAIAAIATITVVLIGAWVLRPRKRKLKKKSRLHRSLTLKRSLSFLCLRDQINQVRFCPNSFRQV